MRSSGGSICSFESPPGTLAVLRKILGEFPRELGGFILANQCLVDGDLVEDVLGVAECGQEAFVLRLTEKHVNLEVL